MKSGGNEIRMGTVEKSTVFGTTSLLKGVGSPYTYRASSRVKVFYLSRHDFESIMGSVKDAFAIHRDNVGFDRHEQLPGVGTRSVRACQTRAIEDYATSIRIKRSVNG